LKLDVAFTLNFINCEIGDIYQSSTKTCDTCAAGTYSLANPYEDKLACKACDEESSECLGGNKIAPRKGYWRFLEDEEFVF